MSEWTGPRWYRDVYPGSQAVQPRGVVQTGDLRDVVQRPERGPLTLPEHVLRLAHREYEAQYGHSQDYERMQERAGLSILEVVGLLADLAERHGATPTTPRSTS